MLGVQIIIIDTASDEGMLYWFLLDQIVVLINGALSIHNCTKWRYIIVSRQRRVPTGTNCHVECFNTLDP